MRLRDPRRSLIFGLVIVGSALSGCDNETFAPSNRGGVKASSSGSSNVPVRAKEIVFIFPAEDNEIRYDRTGVGDAVGEMISEVFDKHKGDWGITPVVFTNAGKQEMVSRVTYAIETGWWRCPRILRVEHEFQALEVEVSKSGLHTFNAPGGDHDDVHWAFALAISGAHATTVRGSQLDMIEAAMSGKLLTTDEEDDDTDLPPGDDGDDGFGDLYDDEPDDDVINDVAEMN